MSEEKTASDERDNGVSLPDAPDELTGITRRDFVHGAALAGMSSMLPSPALAAAMEKVTADPPSDYPPGLTGLRGNHDGSWEAAHKLARSGQNAFGPVRHDEASTYDLVVVGGGISGLAAAYYFRQAQPAARILILDNHDDFGGHAKRNEFKVSGRTLLGYGGSQTMEAPAGYPPEVKNLLQDLGVEQDAFYEAYDDGFYRRHDLAAGVFFNAADWGKSALVRSDLGGLGDYLPLAIPGQELAQRIAQMPLSPPARDQLLRVLTESRDCMPDIPVEEKEDYLYTITYSTFLERHLGVTEPEVFRVFRELASDTGLSIERAPAASAIFYSALPGRDATGLPPDETDYEPYIHHFPDGNASIARLLVRSLIPEVAEGDSMQDIVRAEFDYEGLDDPGAKVQLRLSSTVVNVQHVGKPSTASEVEVTYVTRRSKDSDEPESCRVSARNVVMACYHAMIPSICPELPLEQREAMAQQVKTPILYTNVALHNWHAWKNLGIGAFVAPSGYHVNAMLDFPVSMGGQKYASTPDDPILVHMERFPHGHAPGLSKRDSLRAGRFELLSTPFEKIESAIKDQLGEALGPGGFDVSRDIAGITVNRWAHGYAYAYDPFEEDYYEDWDDPRYPHVKARQVFGRIAIANSDADANAMLESAIEQAHRAVTELVSQG